MRHWLQISAGRGPAECAWVVPRLLSRLIEEATRRGLKAEMLEAVPGSMPRTLDSALIAVEGPGAADFLEQVKGTVLWIGRSPFRPQHKRKNWFVGVEAYSMPRQPRWSEKDLKFETMRASGPGGQHVNKTESAVRVTHLPTGMSTTAREERSQAANRKLALARLAEAFADAARAQTRAVEQQRWMQHNTLERGNAVRVYEGEEFKIMKKPIQEKRNA